ncbi:MAG TPA: hypothetical protein DD654_07030 [Leuconostoc lactis]|nr:hypothetical protein [Leuconostoc lactis]
MTQAKDFTTSSISNSDSGMRSQITQASNAIIAKNEATNLVTNSEFDPDNVGWYKLPADGSTIDVSGKVTTPIKSYYADWDAVNGSRGMEFGATTGTWITSEPVRASSTGTYSISVLAGRPIAPATAVTMDFRLGLWDKDKKYITSVGSTNPLNGTTYLPLKYYKSENITVPSNTAFVSFVLGHSGSGTPDAIYHPMINHGATISPYTPTYGTTASSTVLSLLKDNWSIGIADNAGAITNGIVGNSTNMSLISRNITLDGNTTVTGDFYAKGGNFKNINASNITVGNLDADEVRIINLDVNTLTGDVSRFLETNWDGAYGSTKITSAGMKINTQYIQADFQGFGMDFSYSNKKIGGMGISQYLNGEPGLSMRLESNGAYMAWSARNEGDSTGSYIDKLAWYRQGKPALGGNYGFIFSDRVTFNKPINIEGTSINLGFRPINLYGNLFPFFGNQDNMTGFAYTSNEIYMVLQNQYVNLSKVIKALSGLGAWSVPTNIDSTGKVTQWRNVTT